MVKLTPEAALPELAVCLWPLALAKLTSSSHSHCTVIAELSDEVGVTVMYGCETGVRLYDPGATATIA